MSSIVFFRLARQGPLDPHPPYGDKICDRPIHPIPRIISARIPVDKKAVPVPKIFNKKQRDEGIGKESDPRLIGVIVIKREARCLVAMKERIPSTISNHKTTSIVLFL